MSARMIEMNGIPPVSATSAVQPAEMVSVEPVQEAFGSVSDVVEISTASILAAKVHEVPEVRTELVERIRQEIDAGTYETEERLDIAVNQLMDELFPEL
jgi:negative regulator of flagellin synthesis FlgM